MLLEAVVIYQFHWLNIELCLATASLNMNMHWLMVTRVEHEPEIEYSEDGGHSRQ